MNEQKNHWSNIWFHPKETIRNIIDTNPSQSLVLLATLGGISQSLSSASSLGLGKMLSINEIFMFAIFSGPLSGFFYLFVVGWLLHQVLTRMGGEAKITETRVVLAWSWVPLVSTLPLWGVKYILFREEFFLPEKPFMEAHPVLSFLNGLIYFVDFALVIWTMVILIAGLTEAHKTPVGKTVGAFIVMNLIVLIPSMLILTLCSPQLPM